jgi:hypothetical protein
MNKRERIIELGAEISATRAKLAAMEAEMDSLLPSEQSTSARSATVVPAGQFSEGTLTDRVIRFLNFFDAEAFTAANIATALQLPRDKMNSLRSTLVRLVEEEKIDRPEPGKYRARREQNVAG